MNTKWKHYPAILRKEYKTTDVGEVLYDVAQRFKNKVVDTEFAQINLSKMYCEDEEGILREIGYSVEITHEKNSKD